jgi:glycosyltransferase involved in cell wall biosynthesis
MKVAIVHDYLHQYGGAEKVVEKFMEMYPEADIYTSFCIPEKFQSSIIFQQAITKKRVKTTWLQFIIPKVIRYFKHFFWLYPPVMSLVIVKNYDLVLISSTYCGKNVRYLNCKKIVHYCHTPSRMIHGLATANAYESINFWQKLALPLLVPWLRWMDLRAANYLTTQGCVWLANSAYIKDLIYKIYKVDSTIVYPPIEIEKFLPIVRKVDQKHPFYYYFGRISFHKRIDLLIQACLELNKTLLISGISALQTEMTMLQKMVTDYQTLHPENSNLVKFLGRLPDEERDKLLSTCKAFVFPAKEDFGIAPIEALAAGVPVIAFGEGGALEYIKNNQNGLFFPEQNVESIKKAILEFESNISKFNPEKIKNSSLGFNSEIFKQKILDIISAGSLK